MNQEEMQRNEFEAYQKFLTEGIKEFFEEISPVRDYTGAQFELYFCDYEFEEPEYSERECMERGLTYGDPLRVLLRLIMKETGGIKEQVLFIEDFPLMTKEETFIIKGLEKAVRWPFQSIPEEIQPAPVGEFLKDYLRKVGLPRLEWAIKERMCLVSPSIAPADLVDTRILTSIIEEFFEFSSRVE